MLTRDQILSIVPVLDKVEVQVPEWGNSVFVRVMTGTERDRFEVRMSESNRVNMRALLAVLTICDDQGRRLFAENEVEELGKHSGLVLERIGSVALRLNKYSDAEIKELEKNSVSSHSNGSP